MSVGNLPSKYLSILTENIFVEKVEVRLAAKLSGLPYGHYSNDHIAAINLKCSRKVFLKRLNDFARGWCGYMHLVIDCEYSMAVSEIKPGLRMCANEYDKERERLFLSFSM